MTLPHHNTSHGNQGCRSETPLLSTKHTRNGNITTSADLSVGLDSHTATKVVEDKGLMSFGQAKLPWQTSVLDSSPADCTGGAVVCRGKDVVGLSLGDTTGNNTNCCTAASRDRLLGTRGKTDTGLVLVG